jgi:hypothetical protein
MYRMRVLALAALALLAIPLASARADFFVGFGARPYYYRHYYRGYYPYRVYVAPPPVYVAPRAVYVTPTPVPVIVQPVPTYLQAVPAAPTQVVPVPVAPPGT